MIDNQYMNMAAEKLREVHGVRSVRVSEKIIFPYPRGRGARFVVELDTEKNPYTIKVDLKGAFDRSVIDRILQDIKTPDELKNTLVVAPYINPSLAEYMDSHGLNFLDMAGNVRLALGRNFYVFVNGKKPKEGSPYIPKAKIASLQFIFAILADPSILNDPVRTIAEKAGVGKTSVSSRINILANEGLIEKSSGGWRINNYNDLLDRWLAGYSEVIAPRLFNGSYRTRISDPDELEAIIEGSLKDYPVEWAWGYLSASWRMVDHYRGETSTLHIPGIDPNPTILNMFLKIQALPSPDGNLVFMRPLGPISMNGTANHLVHPLLVYTQLITSHDPRAIETAMEIRQFLSNRGSNDISIFASAG
jgi:hypothetical protein